MQIYKLQPVSKPEGERVKLLFPAGTPCSPDESAAQLAQAAQDGKPVLMTVSALRTLLSLDNQGFAQLTAGGSDFAQLGGSEASVGGDTGTTQGDAESVAGGLVISDASTNALLAQHTAPLADVLLSDVAQPDWRTTVAPEHESMTDPTDSQRALMHAAAAGDVESLNRALEACSRLEASQAALPPSGGSALHLAAAGGHQVKPHAQIGSS